MTARAGGSVHLKSRVSSNLSEIHQKLVMTIGDISVWIVNGQFIRNWIFIDFTEGGNPEAYVWMPNREIWLDTDVHPTEQRYVLLHELTELNEMEYNKLDYDPAHEKANKVELEARRNPGMYDRLFREQKLRRTRGTV